MRNRALLVTVFIGVWAASALGQLEENRNYSRWNFNVGGGLGDGRGDVGSFVGNSFFALGGAGMNFSRLFGFNGEYMYYDMTLRRSVSAFQGLGTTSGSLHVASLNGIVRSPWHLDRYAPYGIFGVGFYDRRITTSTASVPPLTVCQPSWIWWDVFCVGNPPLTPPPNPIYPKSGTQYLGSMSKIAGGYNYGGGITYRLNRWHNAKVYAEFRVHKGYHSDVPTVVWPFTVGLRW